MSRSQGYATARLSSLAVALLFVTGLSGCGKATPPETCPWAATPRGITSGDLVGTFTGKDAHGAATAMTLGRDGRFTVNNYQYRDWYSGTWLAMTDGASWTFELDRGRLDRLLDRPGSAFVNLDDHIHTTLQVGGDRAHPVLYDRFNDYADSCELVFSLLRQT
jgi:hypothetical protein